MNGIHKKKWFLPSLVLIIIFVIIILVINNRTVDGSKGGILEGASHKDGGIKGRVKGERGTIIMEKNEAIINNKSMSSTDRLVCYGTPVGIASKVNEWGGGVEFDENGTCRLQ